MASIKVSVQLNNVDGNINANQLADIIEDMIRRHTGLEPNTSIFDNDGPSASNPVGVHDSFKRVRRI